MSDSKTKPVPVLAETAATAEVTAKFHVCFQDERIGTFELAVAAAPLLSQITDQVTALTDADLQAIGELFLAADAEVRSRQLSERRITEFLHGHHARLAEGLNP